MFHCGAVIIHLKCAIEAEWNFNLTDSHLQHNLSGQDTEGRRREGKADDG
jgi:hypothetical protein